MRNIAKKCVSITQWAETVIDFVIEATLRVNWDAQYGWIGVVESSESDKCETLDGVLVCDTEDLDFCNLYSGTFPFIPLSK